MADPQFPVFEFSEAKPTNTVGATPSGSASVSTEAQGSANLSTNLTPSTGPYSGNFHNTSPGESDYLDGGGDYGGGGGSGSGGTGQGPAQQPQQSLQVGQPQWSSDAQFLRLISLIVYGGVASANANPQGFHDTSAGETAPLPSRLRRPRDDSTTLPDVNVTAPAPQQPQQTATQTGSQGLELGALRVTFNIHCATNATPNILEAKVYNLAPATMDKIKQFGRVQLSAGYKYSNFGMLFDGTVVQYRQGKENPTDTYLEIIAGDGDNMPAAVSFRRFEPGTQESAAVTQLAKDAGYALAYLDKAVGVDKLIRPWIVAGSTSQALREITQKYDADYWVDRNQLYIVNQASYLPGTAVVLAPNSGLVSIPELTPGGIQARCLINPKLRLGGLVKLDKTLISGIPYYPGSSNAEMTDAAVTPNYRALQTYSLPILPPTSPIGIYKIIFMEISGDTRGRPWYDDLTCIALDANGRALIGADSSPFSRGKFALPNPTTVPHQPGVPTPQLARS